MLPIRQIPAWATSLEKAKAGFEARLPLGNEKLSEVAGWMLLEHVQRDLDLDGIKIDRGRLSGLLDGLIAPATAEDRQAVNYGMAVRYLSDYASGASEAVVAEDATPTARGPAELTSDLLLALHRLALGDEDPAAGRWRTQPANPLYASQDPCLPEELPVLISLALDWFSAESVRELHPLEQAAIVHLRLYELQPFDRAGGRISRLASSLYSIRAGLPPIILDPAEAPRYYQALLSGFQMNTRPLVELFSEACRRVLLHLTEIIRGDAA